MLPKLARNRYVIGAAKYAAAAAGLSFAYFGVAKLKENFQDSHDNHVKEKLTEFIPSELVDKIRDDDYLDIVYRLLEFRGLNAIAFQETIAAIADLCVYKETIKRPNHFAVKQYCMEAHKVLNCVRRYRAYLEQKSPSVLDDFDLVATDIQGKYDEDHESLLFDAQLRY
jgi:hypothetical protein